MMNKQFLFTFVVITIQVSFAQTTPEFSSRIDMGLVEHPELTEASGLVESRKNAHVLWSHNDRNNQNRLFAFNSAGTHLGIYWIDGVENRDWEDLAIGPGPIPNVDYLYIGDIGDNDAVHENKYIYRVPEPVVDFNQVPVEITIFDVDTIIFQYPDGNRDAETLLLDPLTKDLYVVSTREFEDIRVYRAPYPQPTNQVFTLEHVATIQLSQIVGGDISPSGLEILLKTYTSMYYWNRSSNQNLWETFDNPPIILPYIEEMQGEAVSWAADSMGYYTLSEEPNNIPAHLFYYPRINPSIVVINEIMQNPLAVGDEFGEWFELFNNSTDPVNLMGWIIKDTDTDFHMISQSIVLSPGEFLVLSNNSDSTTNGGLKVDYQYNNIVLDNSVDEILMVSPTGVVVDSVAYDNGVTFPNTKGTSMALLNENMDNSFGLNWRESTLTFGDGDLGTPGLSNSVIIPFLSVKDIQFTTDSS
ncbi:MAG: lamin tail domain-containing protein, partial [Bacteroidetes bacterium]|nr:lamin tail domain-containing protein [Bacteroidota bacterium]